MTDFEITVKQMREAQIERDRTHASIPAALAKRLEIKVDQHLKGISIPNGQGGLF